MHIYMHNFPPKHNQVLKKKKHDDIFSSVSFHHSLRRSKNVARESLKLVTFSPVKRKTFPPLKENSIALERKSWREYLESATRLEALSCPDRDGPALGRIGER